MSPESAIVTGPIGPHKQIATLARLGEYNSSQKKPTATGVWELEAALALALILIEPQANLYVGHPRLEHADLDRNGASADGETETPGAVPLLGLHPRLDMPN